MCLRKQYLLKDMQAYFAIHNVYKSTFNWPYIAEPTNHWEIDCSINRQFNMLFQVHEGMSTSSNTYKRKMSLKRAGCVIPAAPFKRQIGSTH